MPPTTPPPSGPPQSRDPHASRLYRGLAPIYDGVLGRFFLPRVTSVIRGLDLPPGARILEIGVGTGASLAAYPRHCTVVGLDRSAQMLREARDRVARCGWTHVRIVEGDATALGFPNDAFDYVMAFHVVSVVREPWRLVAETVRVSKPGGLVTVVNRFRSPLGPLGRLEKHLEPLTERCGWRTLRMDDLLDGHPLRVLGTRRGGPLGLFTAVVARNEKAASPAG